MEIRHLIGVELIGFSVIMLGSLIAAVESFTGEWKDFLATLWVGVAIWLVCNVFAALLLGLVWVFVWAFS